MTAPTPAGWYPDPTGKPMRRYFDGRDWTEHYAAAAPAPAGVVVTGPNHVMHLLLTLMTAGLWLIVWACISISNNKTIDTVDENGNIIPRLAAPGSTVPRHPTLFDHTRAFVAKQEDGLWVWVLLGAAALIGLGVLVAILVNG